MLSLFHLGFSEFFAKQLLHFPGLVPARITADNKTLFEIAGARAQHASLAGLIEDPLARPTTGDWVAVADGERAIIHHVLQRRTLLQRRAAGTDERPQNIAANVDVVFVVASADSLNRRKLERYLAMVRGSGADAIVVVNKIDLGQTETDGIDARVIEVSALSGDGMPSLAACLRPDLTFAFLGPSGVGKSSLVNRLVGDDVLSTNETYGHKGRHTTTRRQLLVLPERGVLIDTPGMRELGTITGDVDAVFTEIAALAERCYRTSPTIW